MVTPQEYSIDKPYIQKIMDVSTAHITSKDNELLRKSSLGVTPTSLVVYSYDYGYFVHVSDELEEAACKVDGYSDHLIGLLRRAKQHDCAFVRLDSDGITYNNLQTFSW